MDLGQGKRDLDFHGLGSRRQCGDISHLQDQRSGAEVDRYNRVVAGEGEEGGTIED